MHDDLHVDIQVLKITMKRPSFQDIMLPHNSIDLLESQSKKRKITIVQDLNPVSGQKTLWAPGNGDSYGPFYRQTKGQR